MSATHCDRDTFVKNLQKSGLVSPREFTRICENLPDTERGRDVARVLVRQGILTKFQAELLLAGRTSGFFLGQYEILDQLGQGGMGRVYKAIHLTMKRIVALKVLAPQLVQTAKAMKMFKREVRAAAQLHHPNIVTAFDANQISGRHYLVMEYVDGPSLDQLVRRQGLLPVPAACEIIRQAACGLQYAHELGLVHRDIKPANILVQKPTRSYPMPMVKILDFGLARLHDQEPTSKERPNAVMGTPDFLSPEQSRNLGIDIRSDIYSLGCTFYFLLTGRVPFPGGTTLEKLLRHSTEEPTTVELFRSDVPAEVLAILARMMAKKLEDRFQTPFELAQALAPFANAGVVQFEQTPAAETALPSSTEIPTPAHTDAAPSTMTAEEPATVPAESVATPFSDDAMFPFWMEAQPAQERSVPWLVVAIAATLLGLITGVGIVLLR